MVEGNFITGIKQEIETWKSFDRKVASTTTTASTDEVADHFRSQQVNVVSQMKIFSNKIPEVISLNKLKHVHPLVEGLLTKDLPVTPLTGILSYFSKGWDTHCVKGVHIRSFSGPYLPAFGLNTEKVSLRIWSEYGENTDQKNSEYGHFSRSDVLIKNQEILVNCRGIQNPFYLNSSPSQNPPFSKNVKNTKTSNRERNQEDVKADHQQSISYITGDSDQHVSGKKERRGKPSGDKSQNTVRIHTLADLKM